MADIVFERVLSGTADQNIRFSQIRGLLRQLGFIERIRGSHHIYSREGVLEILNLQPRGSLAKPYRVKQIRQIIFRYKLTTEAE